MATLLIDYENTNGKGLQGVDLLKPTDTLIIFYSKVCSWIREEYIDTIRRTGCVFITRKLRKQGDNYLDMYICTEVGILYKGGENEVAIISKDKGLSAPVEYFQEIGAKDFQIIRTDDIEQALAFFSNPADYDRRAVIAVRCKMVSLDDVTVQLKERNSIRGKIEDALVNTPYWFKIKDVCELVSDNTDGKKSLYTGAMHTFGRDEGRQIYRIIKDVI